MINIPATDTDFEDVMIDGVRKHDSGWEIGHGAIWFGGVPADSPVEPKEGMTARFYGGAHPGCTVYGLALDGVPIFYKTAEQRSAEREAWLAEHRERQRLIALEPRLPNPQLDGFEWTDDMREISGFHGGYERTCRAMVSAGCKWWSEHPDANPQFHGFKGIYGIITEDNHDAKTLSKVVTDAASGDCTGAMHQASISHIFAWRQMGSWVAYQKKMRELERSDPDDC